LDDVRALPAGPDLVAAFDREREEGAQLVPLVLRCYSSACALIAAMGATSCP